MYVYIYHQNHKVVDAYMFPPLADLKKKFGEQIPVGVLGDRMLMEYCSRYHARAVTGAADVLLPSDECNGTSSYS